MATTVSAGPGKVNTITASGTLSLGNAGDLGYAVSRWIVQYTVAGGTFTITPQKTATISDPSPNSTNTQLPFANTWYTDAIANAPQAAGTLQSAAGIMDIDAACCDVQLVITVAGGGTVSVVANPAMG